VNFGLPPGQYRKKLAESGAAPEAESARIGKRPMAAGAG
jgi:hypothetical protein